MKVSLCFRTSSRYVTGLEKEGLYPGLAYHRRYIGTRLKGSSFKGLAISSSTGLPLRRHRLVQRLRLAHIRGSAQPEVARTTRSHKDRNSLQPKLEGLVALALLVVMGLNLLGSSVRNRDDVGRFKDTTLQLSLVGVFEFLFVGIGGVNTLSIAAFAVRTVGAI